jgi:hypothetical protein
MSEQINGGVNDEEISDCITITGNTWLPIKKKKRNTILIVLFFVVA